MESKSEPKIEPKSKSEKRKEYMDKYTQTEKFKASKHRYYERNKEYLNAKRMERYWAQKQLKSVSAN